MARQRERFERTDVPRNNPARPFIAVAVIIVVAIASVILVSAAWHKANQMNGLNNLTYNEALYEQGYTTDPTDGAKRSDDDFSNVAVFIVDDIRAETPQLTGAQILVRDTENPRATIVSFPLNTKMLANDSNVTLGSYFAERGPAPCLAPFTAAANIHVSHMIVATERIWDQIEKLEGSTPLVLLSSATDELETIASDYHTHELIELGDWLRALGFDNIARIDAPFNEEQFEDGTVVSNIDTRQLNISVGIFVEPEPEPEPEPEGGEEGWGEGEWYYEEW